MQKRLGPVQTCSCEHCRKCYHRRYMRAWRKTQTPWALSVRAEAAQLAKIGCPLSAYTGSAERILERARGIRRKALDLFDGPERIM